MDQESARESISGSRKSNQKVKVCPNNLNTMTQIMLSLILLLGLMNHLPTADGTRCFICSWSIQGCLDFNCYNNPDTCSNSRFSPALVQETECPNGCEQFLITDPNGVVQQWRRNCAPGNIPTGGYICRTEYQFGIRIDRCYCNRDWCNSAHLPRPSLVQTLVGLIIVSAVMYLYR